MIDIDALAKNISSMATEMGRRGVALRPHFKTARTIEIARRVMNAGAVGLTCATIGEAEALVDGGIFNIFIAYPIWLSSSNAVRLRRLLHEPSEISVGADSAEAIAQLAQALDGSERVPRVLIEVDSGERRTGVIPSAAGQIAAEAIRLGFEVLGAFTHGGHGYAPGQRTGAGHDEERVLRQAARALRKVGAEPRVLSAGSTPTAFISARGVVNEERPGSYVFQDRQQVRLGSCDPGDVALVVAARVVSTAVPGQFVIDAGAKCLSKDKAAWLGGFGHMPAYPQATIERIFDHHAVCVVPDDFPRPRVGQLVAVVPNHVCPVVNLSKEIVVARDGLTIDRWPVLARGL